MCWRKSLDVQQYICAVIFQLAAISSHVMRPEYLAIVPPRKRPWCPASTATPLAKRGRPIGEDTIIRRFRAQTIELSASTRPEARSPCGFLSSRDAHADLQQQLRQEYQLDTIQSDRNSMPFWLWTQQRSLSMPVCELGQLMDDGWWKENNQMPCGWPNPQSNPGRSESLVEETEPSARE